MRGFRRGFWGYRPVAWRPRPMLWGPPIYRRPWRPLPGIGWGLLALLPMLLIFGLILIGMLLRSVF